MFNIFNNNVSGRAINNNRMSLLKRRNTLVLNQIIKYWNQSAVSTTFEHPLVKALSLFEYIFTENKIDIYYYAKEQVERITRVLGFCSTLHRGGILKDKQVIYGCKNEIIVNLDMDDGLSKIIELSSNPEGWLRWETCRVVKHPFDDFSYERPGSKNYPLFKYKNEIVVFHIDLALMYVQYRLWLKSKYAIFENNQVKPVTDFVASIVEPNILPSHIDLCFWNRLYRMDKGEEVNSPKINTRKSISNLYLQVDEAIRNYINLLPEVNSVNAFFNDISGLSSENLGEFFKIDYPPHNEHFNVVKALPILNLHEWLGYFFDKYGYTPKLGHIVNEYKRKVISWNNNNAFRNIKDLDVDVVKEQITRINVHYKVLQK